MTTLARPSRYSGHPGGGLPQLDDLAAVIARLIGPPPGRVGGDSRRLWWVCPFHDDQNPSLCVDHDGDRYHCFGCGVGGDTIDFVRRLDPTLSFREAVAVAGGDGSAPLPSRTPAPRPPRPEPAPLPAGWQAFAQQLVADGEAALWSDFGAEAREYLAGRGLAEETIRAARLGFSPVDAYVQGIFDRPVWVPRGITIPWLDDDTVTMVNVRRPDGSDPKYWAVRGSRRGDFYPSRRLIKTGRPVVLVEGEFEALLLGQELAGAVPVLTLGSAGDRPGADVLLDLAKARTLFVSLDADPAGDAAAERWVERSARCRRVRPPVPWKDWTDARRDGLDLMGFWAGTITADTLDEYRPTLLHPAVRAEDADWREPAAWRETVAGWSHERWCAWRRRVTELVDGRSCTAELVRTAEHAAFIECADGVIRSSSA